VRRGRRAKSFQRLDCRGNIENGEWAAHDIASACPDLYTVTRHCVIPMLPATSLLFPVAFVLPLYLSPTSLPRGHPRTVRARILISTLFSVCFSWVPTYIKLRAVRSQVCLPYPKSLPSPPFNRVQHSIEHSARPNSTSFTFQY
jgi:hypothetical protein